MAATVRDEEFVIALKSVARLGGYRMKKLATADDLEKRTLTVSFEIGSEGFVQEVLTLEEREAITYEVNGRGEVEGLQPDDAAVAEATAEQPEGFTPNPIDEDPIENREPVATGRRGR